jgi:putative transposase
VGRDSLFELLRDHRMLVKRKRKGSRTTYSKHGYSIAPNLVKERTVSRPLEVLVGDITYLRLRGGRFAYLYLLTDLFTRRIVGYHVSLDLTHESALMALKNAGNTVGAAALRGTIHHTDRGSQYCCGKYREVLDVYGMLSSMTDENHCYQNGVAERVNGILKDEYDLDAEFISMWELQRAVARSVQIYNEERRHRSLGYRTPTEVYRNAA